MGRPRKSEENKAVFVGISFPKPILELAKEEAKKRYLSLSAYLVQVFLGELPPIRPTEK